MYRKIVKVFLGSPGDLEAERIAASRIVQEINRNHADFWNVQIELVGWEDTVSRFGRAQAVINQDLDQCEYFIGLMWQRWGSPPGGKGHPYTSGFEEEFQRSIDRREQTGVPEISLLFKAPEEGRMQDPGKELTKVLAFKKNMIDSKTVLFQEFREDTEFESKFRSLLINYVQRMILTERATEERTEAGAKREESDKDSTPSEASGGHLFGADATAFIQNLVTRLDPINNVTSADVARMRLLGCAVNRGGNDTQLLGPHDANLVYADRHNHKLTDAEVASLITSGAVHLPSENVPLWGWLFQIEMGPEGELVWQTVVWDASIKASLVKCLTKARFNLADKNLPLKRKEILELWLETETEDVKNAAIEYLENCGERQDIELLRPLFEAPTSNIAERSVSAAIVIASRYDIEEAFSLLEAHPLSSFREDVLTALFGHPSQIRSERLMTCLEHRSADVRQHALEILFSRTEISAELAEKLLSDPSPEIRYQALMMLHQSGHTYTLEAAKKILVRTTQSPRGGGLSGLFVGSPTTEGDELFDDFKLSILKQRSRAQLEQEAEKASVYEFETTYALYQNHYKQLLPEIEYNLKDAFTSEFDRRLGKLRSATDPGLDLLTRIENQSEHIRKDVCERTLSIVCKHGDASAIDLVRLVLDRDQTYFLYEVVDFLERYGAWEDAQRIADLTERKNYSKKGILYFNTAEQIRAAKAILKLGKNRLADVFSLNLSSSVLSYIIEAMTNKQFLDLPDAAILSFMNEASSEVRKAASLKTIVSLPRKRAEELLQTYISGDKYRYYNVIHWLDVAVSTPSPFAKPMARRELSVDLK